MRNPLRMAIRALDSLLRKTQQVEEFTDDPECILRLSFGQSPSRIKLGNGLEVDEGQPIGELHLWNEHIPAMPPQGPDLKWGKDFVKKMRHSLRLLAQFSTQDPRMAEVQVLSGEIAFPRDKAQQLDLLAKQLGFNLDSQKPKGPWERFAEFWQNLYSMALIWAFNPPSLKKKTLLGMRRYRLWMTKEELLRRYGGR